ncbi:hypothetical protein [Actinokineospora sp.]|uniref:hypothetical protein n=1 Tax=Actinokineospora sp. TaxID=1872133 RepID=UPI003D6B9744
MVTGRGVVVVVVGRVPRLVVVVVVSVVDSVVVVVLSVVDDGTSEDVVETVLVVDVGLAEVDFAGAAGAIGLASSLEPEAKAATAAKTVATTTPDTPRMA